MRAGFVQFAPTLGDVAANVTAVRTLLESAPQADVLVLPELSNSGYNFVSKEQARAVSEPLGDGPFQEMILEMASRRGMHIVVGICERDQDSLYNTAILCGPDGLVGYYRKIHLFFNEKDFFKPGDSGLAMFTLGDWQVGLLVCFDWAFPEIWRSLGLKGADLICHPSCLVYPPRALRAAAVHAQCNGMYVITCNRYGKEGTMTFRGQSSVFGPDGEVIVSADNNSDCMRVAELSLDEARNKMLTSRNHVLKDRRPEYYELD